MVLRAGGDARRGRQGAGELQEGEGGPGPKEGVKADTERDGVKENSNVRKIGARAVGGGGACVHDWMGGFGFGFGRGGAVPIEGSGDGEERIDERGSVFLMIGLAKPCLREPKSHRSFYLS